VQAVQAVSKKKSDITQFNLVLASSFIALQMGDIVTTSAGLGRGNAELNPLADSIFRLPLGFVLFAGVKMAVAFVVVVVLLRHPGRLNTGVLAVLTVLIGLVVVHNLLSLR
jgi:uncharacterized membrane protein HdeD (DUF308 family)